MLIIYLRRNHGKYSKLFVLSFLWISWNSVSSLKGVTFAQLRVGKNIRFWSLLESMLILKLPEGRKSIVHFLWSQYREKALHVSLTIYTSQRPRQNINILSQPNLRGLRTGKPTTSCLCSCFKLNRVKNATNKRFHEQKKQSKSFARVLKTLYTS